MALRNQRLFLVNHLLDPAVFATLPDWLAQRGHPAYRAKQVRQWLFATRAESFEEMTDLPSELRGQLAADFQLWTTIDPKASSRRPTAPKSCCCDWPTATRSNACCCATARGARSASVRRSAARWAACSAPAAWMASCEISPAGEIVEQMLRLARLLPADERLSHIVVMGMGEPLANLDRLLPALADATSSTGLGISHRRITISTVGLPPAIDRLVGARRPISTGRFAARPRRRAAQPTGAGEQEHRPASDRDRRRSILRSFRPAADVRVRAAGRIERSSRNTPRNWRRCCAAAWRSSI